MVADLNDAGLVSGQLSDLVAGIDYGQVVGIATGLLASLTDAFSTLVLLLIALVFITIEASGFGHRMALVAAERPHLPVAMTLFAQGTRSYLLVSTVFGAIVAFADWIALMIIGIPAAALWALLSFITNYVPNIGFVLGLLPPALLGLLAGGWREFIAVVIVYSVLNFVIQTLIQPRFVGDSVGLSVTVTFIALLFWGWVLGALGALLAIPLTLLFKALLVDVDPRGHWLDALLREEPRRRAPCGPAGGMHARRAALASVRRLHHVRRPHGAAHHRGPAHRPTTSDRAPRADAVHGGVASGRPCTPCRPRLEVLPCCCWRASVSPSPTPGWASLLLTLGFFALDLLTPGHLGQRIIVDRSLNASLVIAAGLPRPGRDHLRQHLDQRHERLRPGAALHRRVRHPRRAAPGGGLPGPRPDHARQARRVRHRGRIPPGEPGAGRGAAVGRGDHRRLDLALTPTA